MIKGHTGRIAGIECAADGRHLATFAHNESYVNVWDLESAEKVLVTPAFRVNANVEIRQVKMKNLKKGVAGILVVLSKDRMQVYKIKYGETAKTLSVNGCIKDDGAMLLACDFYNKTDIMVRLLMISNVLQ